MSMQNFCIFAFFILNNLMYVKKYGIETDFICKKIIWGCEYYVYLCVHTLIFNEDMWYFIFYFVNINEEKWSF